MNFIFRLLAKPWYGILFSILILSACSKEKLSDDVLKKNAPTNLAVIHKKVLFVNSYHKGYEWSDGITESIKQKFNKKNTTEPARIKVELKVVYMDTKRNQSESFINEAAHNVKGLIESWRPDLVITSDDNAAQYVIADHFKKSTIPFVFCGVNGDASAYDFSRANVTGMVEVQLIGQILKTMRAYAQGNRIAILKGNDQSALTEATFFDKQFKISLDKRFVNTFAEWKEQYLKLQDEADMLLLGNPAAIPDWDENQAKQLIMSSTTIPSGNWDAWMAPYSLVTFSTKPEEQGEWAAQAAYKILAGAKPATIPVVSNKKAKIILNMPLAKKIGIIFPVTLMQNATLIGPTRKKVLHVNSYHQGYLSSDNMETGFQKATGVEVQADGSLFSRKHNFELRIHRMDTKNNNTEDFKKAAALKVKQQIEQWKPDIVIANDDNAAKYLIAPYYKNTQLPFVFCGINWDASVYGFPCDNITGIIEVEPVIETIAMLKQYSHGTRLGYLGPDNISEQKKITIYKKLLGIEFSDGLLVDTFDQWKAAYLRLQSSTDMFLILGCAGIKDWNDNEALSFIYNTATVPTGGTADGNMALAHFGQTEVTEEQGWEAGKMVVSILSGTQPQSIPLRKNKGQKLFMNLKLTQKLGIKFPVEVLDKAVIIK